MTKKVKERDRERQSTHSLSDSVKIACERLECWFMSVGEVTRTVFPPSSQARASSAEHTGSSMAPDTTERKKMKNDKPGHNIWKVSRMNMSIITYQTT